MTGDLKMSNVSNLRSVSSYGPSTTGRTTRIQPKGEDLSKLNPQLSLERSLEEYPVERFIKLLLAIQKKAKETGQISKDYDILSKVVKRQFYKMDDITPAHIVGKQTKSNSATEQRVKALINSFLGGFRYDLPLPILIHLTGQLIKVLAAGDHRFVAKKDLNWIVDICDGLILDVDGNEDDATIYDMLSTQSNDHPPEFALTNGELASKLYSRIVKNEKWLKVFDPMQQNYQKKKCYDYITSYKHNISDTTKGKVLKLIQEKLGEGIITGMFKTLAGTDEVIDARKHLGIDGRNDIITVEIGLIDRYLFDTIAYNANTGITTYIILRVNNSNFAISQEKLNTSRGNALFGGKKELKSSAKLAFDNFRKLQIPEKFLKTVKIIGFYAQHNCEDPTKVIRVQEVVGKPHTYVSSEHSIDEALQMNGMVN